jgi:hypothetical protein
MMQNRITGFYPSLPEPKGITVKLNESPSITIEFENTPHTKRATVCFEVNGLHFVYRIENDWKAVTVAKSKILHDSLMGLFSEEVAQDVRDLIDATMGD